MSSMSNTSCKTFLLDNKLLERKEGGGEEGLTSEGSLVVRGLVPPPVRVHDGGDGARPRAWPDAGAVPG